MRLDVRTISANLLVVVVVRLVLPGVRVLFYELGRCHCRALVGKEESAFQIEYEFDLVRRGWKWRRGIWRRNL